MTEKVQKIREKVEQLKSNLIYGACSSQIAMETCCKEEAYNEVLAILDTMQEEPVSGLDNGDMPIERWKQAVKAASNQRNYRSSKGLTETRDDYFVDGVQWADEHPKKEHVSEDLMDATNNYCVNVRKGYPRIMDETDRYICNAFKAGAMWQKEHLMKDAVDGEIGYWNLRWLSVNADLPRSVAEGDKVKVILIKEK